MNPKIKVLISILLSFIILNMSSVSYATTNQSENMIIPMSAICPNCGYGYMINKLLYSKTYFDHYDLCEIRSDCIITVNRTESTYETHCGNCGFGATYQSITYNYIHSKSHY